MSTRSFLNSNGEVLIGFMGFYPDGRLIVDNIIERNGIRETPIRNSIETAGFAGYYTTKHGKILLQYFEPTDGGNYLKGEGGV